MTEVATWVPRGVDVSVPCAARMYDYLLGGGHNFAVDRELGERVASALPGAHDVARLNRAFLRRAVLLIAESGIRQFLDIGTGIPTVGNVHEIAQRADPEARIVYVDNEPVTVAHSELILEGNDRATAIQADLRDPDGILGAAATRELIDFDQPLGLLMVGVFHFIQDSEGPLDLLARYREALAPGSHLALSHCTADCRPDEMAAMVRVMKRGKDPMYPRSHAEVTALFTGFELLEPGVVPTALWRPASPGDVHDGPERDQIYAGVGVKR